MRKYFKEVHTIEELRKEYRSLLKKYHPDNPTGNVEIMQAINVIVRQKFAIFVFL